jgi:hypothetical protein
MIFCPIEAAGPSTEPPSTYRGVAVIAAATVSCTRSPGSAGTREIQSAADSRCDYRIVESIPVVQPRASLHVAWRHLPLFVRWIHTGVFKKPALWNLGPFGSNKLLDRARDWLGLGDVREDQLRNLGLSIALGRCNRLPVGICCDFEGCVS